MRYGSLVLSLTVLAAGIAGSGLAAQETAAGGAAQASAPAGPSQTVEGAQEFLRLISSQFPFVSGDITDSNNYMRTADIRFEPNGQCSTRATRRYEWRQTAAQSDPNLDAEANFEGWLAHFARVNTINAIDMATYRKSYAGTLVPADINWSSVSSVKTYKTGQYETTERGVVVYAQPAFTLVAPDAATAARVAYAMEFLRSACDESATTGF